MRLFQGEINQYLFEMKMEILFQQPMFGMLKN